MVALAFALGVVAAEGATLNWKPLAGPGCGARGVAQAVRAGDTAYAASAREGRFEGVGKSVDGGRNWTLLEGPARGLPRAGTPSPAVDVHCLPDQPRIAWTLAGGTLFRTSDGGASWGPVGGVAGLTAFCADPVNPSRFFVGGREGIYLSTDGLSLQLIPDSPRAPVRLALAPGDAFVLYAVLWRGPDGGLWRNVGRSWVRVRPDPAVADVAVDPRDPRRLAVATRDGPGGERNATGVWVTADGGRNWVRANAGVPERSAAAIRFDPRDPERLVLVLAGRGCYGARWPLDSARGKPRVTSSGGGS